MRSIASLLAVSLALAGAACSKPGAPSDSDPASVFRERSEDEVNASLAAAKDQARREGKRVLLEFVAPWCSDCREVAKIAAQEPAASVMHEKYVLVPVNVGRFDRNKALLREHEIQVIAALVVIDPDGRHIAKTTLEPISKKDALTPQELAEWLRAPSGS
jgi:thioredoxin 1